MLRKRLQILPLFILPFVAMAQWQKVDDFAKPLADLKAIECGDSVLFIGGQPGDYATYTDQITVFYPGQGKWGIPIERDSLAELPEAVVGDSAIYISRGGIVDLPGSLIVGSSEIFIYKQGKWSTYRSPDSMCFVQGIKVGSKIMFAGGIKVLDFTTGLMHSTPSDYIIVFDELTQTWSTDTLSVKRCNVAAASDGKIALFAGGIDASNNASDVVDIYNSATDSWSVSALSQARSLMAGVYAGGKFLFAGGVDEKDIIYDAVDIYDGSVWTTANLSEGRSTIKVDATDTRVVFSGGGNYNIHIFGNHNSNTFDVYDLSAGTWTSGALPYNLSAHCTFSHNETTYIAGGASTSPLTVHTAIYSYDPSAGVKPLKVNREKTIYKIVDVMGRETGLRPNTPLIIIYTDGTRERVMEIE